MILAAAASFFEDDSKQHADKLCDCFLPEILVIKESLGLDQWIFYLFKPSCSDAPTVADTESSVEAPS